MRKIILVFALFLGVAACKTNPFTGKKVLNFYPNSQIFPTAFAQYDQFLTENKVVENTADAKMITKVGQRISSAAERWLTANGYSGYLKDYQWEYNLVNDETVNAWCMPGGKIVFYTGILPICKGEAGIAVVMGHEVAHALADHGAQRMSAGTLQQLGAVAGSVAIQDPEKRDMFNQAYAVGSQVGVMLPFSRSHETEADRIGLQIMAIAGYDPAEAAELWKRMKANSGGEAPPEFMSTHPSNDTRINNLTEWAPAARAEAKKFGVTSFQK
ncbi:M48 family metallopeptidase [Zobellia galactanivorans]|uniref:Metallopeptidase, family M48 n=1 Tax=Zobellia galactanivorans (strain DSM 12802 / CCUG 47099 / CIP 106680 / NCIMB 13871 / Dsij) TaxID=63186 RepID=G0L111_ZOBGA|nr:MULTISPECIES: M48 family metallopeptidase [Zobellia]MBU3026974.1 M48 family metallopeptidase [Zobellia galactanivorans]MDO6810236.1 M48 family metallopeptidase [Zobellia galactanivorans]OWW23825.1 peptidase M48 [Zobellia sp. OII3]CAZ94587.1 Metallopeptidase, family M48 [Zobellia galactanivorans]